jgi:hypothetical protein
MKQKLIFVLLLIFGFSITEAQKTYVPDDGFEQYLIDEGYDDVLDDSVTTENINTITVVSIPTPIEEDSIYSVNDLTGIQDFTALTRLYVTDNNLTSLDVSGLLNLYKIYCMNNAITNLNVSNTPAFTDLLCYSNQLTTLDVSTNTLLERLVCSDNQLTSLDVSNNTSLTVLHCNNNHLSGTMPESICNLSIDFSDSAVFNISNNQFCSPYPSCIEEYVGEQDTTNCGQVSIIDETLPVTYKLYNAYPNPFNPLTTLQYDLPEDAVVNITIYDMMGRVVSNLVSSQQNAGYKSIQWNATNDRNEPVSSGLYIYTIQAGDYTQTKKMVLLK